MIRVMLPYHLQNLAKVGEEVALEVKGVVTIASVLDALEASYPMLRGTVRDHVSKQRRSYIRFFVCMEDWSGHPTDTELPSSIRSGSEPFRVIGAIVGG